MRDSTARFVKARYAERYDFKLQRAMYYRLAARGWLEFHNGGSLRLTDAGRAALNKVK